MPYKSWKHYCPQREKEIVTHQEICEHCGQHGEFTGWIYNHFESMAAYSRFTGLKATGIHRPLADELLAELYRPCEACSGRGLQNVNEDRDYRPCPVCNGMGRVLSVDRETFAAARLQLLMIYPDAALGVPLAGEESKYDRYAQ